MGDRRAYLKVSNEMMNKLILGRTKFRDGRVTAMSWTPRTNCWMVYFTHPELPEVPEGEVTPLSPSWEDVGQEGRRDGPDG